MTLIAIHQVRTRKGAPPEPVGVWAISGEEGEPFYPPEHEKYLARAQKALMARPHIRLEEWVQYKAKTSSNWRIPGLFNDFLTFDAPPEEIYRQAHDEYLSHVAMLPSKYDERFGFPQAHGNAKSAQEEQYSSASWGSNRFAIAQSWWIASELVRRHPELITHEMHPGGIYDVLRVTSPPSVWPRVMLNRPGTVQVHYEDHDAHVVGDWAHVLAASTPHTVVKELEGATGWGSPESAPPTTPRSLAYRFLATALTMLVNDRHAWDARSEFDDDDYLNEPNAGFVDTFPAVIEDLRSTPRLGIWGEPHSHYWALLRDKKPVVIVSIEGKLYYPSGKTVDLMSAYDQHDRRIIPMTTALLKKWL